MGETAPLLFTIATATTLSASLTQPMNTLPTQIFQDITSPRNAVVDRAWGAALTLVVLVLIFNIVARLAARRSRMT
jgi:phosphate transport system permease protein